MLLKSVVQRAGCSPKERGRCKAPPLMGAYKPVRIILDYDSGLGANEHWLGINSKFEGLGEPYFSRVMVSMLIVFVFKLIYLKQHKN